MVYFFSALFTVIFIDGVRAARRLFGWVLKASWKFFVFLLLLAVIPTVDLFLMAFWLIAFLVCLIFKQKKPTVKHAGKGLIYPSWEY